ncbi:MAG: hypothetical protein ACHQF4_02315 [Sphingobacteriales bacterium]|jgi:hypothetical protein
MKREPIDWDKIQDEATTIAVYKLIMKSKNVEIRKISSDQINLYRKDNKSLIGRITKAFIYGEWWCEPEDGRLGELIKGKKQAINFLLFKERNGILNWDKNISDLSLRKGLSNPL